jgi:glycogen debranching enzyme
VTGESLRVLAASAAADDRTRALKHGDTFAVFDHRGYIGAGSADEPVRGLGEQGLYHDGTRFLSTWALEVLGTRPPFLGGMTRDEHAELVASFTNTDVELAGGRVLPLGTIHVAVKKLLWAGAMHERIVVVSYAEEPVEVDVVLHFAADFADIYEVRGMRRQARGIDLPPVVHASRVILGYRGLDGRERRTELSLEPAPTLLDVHAARYRLRLEPRAEHRIDVAVACNATGEVPRFDQAERRANAALERYRSGACRVASSNDRPSAWIARAIEDLHMLTTELPTGPYPYAGIPWFNTPFGRDGIVTGLQCLWARPELARGVLRYLASTQADRFIAEEDAEPGKILHETRAGEMARTKEMPFARYYGTADATPLFVVLAGAHFERTADMELVRALWPHVEAALEWIDRWGDRDGDGFVEYERRTPEGLLHQGWKDSDDAIFHADGSVAKGPIALAEVQGYVYAAFTAAAGLAAALGRPHLSRSLEQRAATLFARFDAAFWCEDLGTYALALDGEKRPCRVRASNAGHCLFSRIARFDRAERVARTLMAPESFSGWGIRTLSTSEPRYNPMGYHTGSVWPHDNALIALGLARYGHTTEALAITSGLLAAGACFELQRMPELFCGFERAPETGPVLHPVACAPQAWAAGSVLMLLGACLGLEVNGAQSRVALTRPGLPAGLESLRVHGLALPSGALDFEVVGNGRNVAVNVLCREGDVQLVVIE